MNARDRIKAAMYEAIDETVEMLWPLLGIPDEDPVEARATELYEMTYGDLPRGIVLPDTVWTVCRSIAEAEANRGAEK